MEQLEGRVLRLRHQPLLVEHHGIPRLRPVHVLRPPAAVLAVWVGFQNDELTALEVPAEVDLQRQPRLHPAPVLLAVRRLDGLAPVDVAGLVAAPVVVHEAEGRVHAEQAAAVELLGHVVRDPVEHSLRKLRIVCQETVLDDAIVVELVNLVPPEVPGAIARHRVDEAAALLRGEDATENHGRHEVRDAGDPLGSDLQLRIRVPRAAEPGSHRRALT
mmetsp:Transcript_56911/g.144326  ORF Transcript_56911/g.144326 Transcript_56911/m.144326 type:complete len:217 (-) Transcript_56911:84-734(-)